MKNVIATPCRINKLEIRNRVVMESVGNGLAELDGKASQADVAFYEARAKGGCGLIMSEAVSVDSKRGRANPRNMCVDSEDQIEPLKILTDTLHRYNCAFFVELYHPGREGKCMFNGGLPMFAPSNIPCKVANQPVEPMTIDDIRYTIDKFIEGAVISKKGGADGVLIHAAHGYLLNEFLSPYTNIREDMYGGSDENRARIVVEIIHGIKEKCGSDYPVAVRLSACEYLDYIGMPREKGITLDNSIAYVHMFEEAGMDLLDVSAGIYETMNTSWEPVSFKQGWKIDLARRLKEEVSVPVVCTSLIRDASFANYLIENNVCDFVGSARAHLADPEWANKAMNGDEDVTPCISCLNCMRTLSRGMGLRCAVNAQTCFETVRSDIRQDGKGRKVVVIGAGPAGLEAARVCGLRGFDVVIYEKEGDIGGALRLAGVPSHKERMFTLIEYYRKALEKLSVKIVLNTSPTPADIEKEDPYAVFVAAGAAPVAPRSIPGINGENVRQYTEVLNGSDSIKGKIVFVIGAGMTGLETAEFLSQNNCVSVYEMADTIAPGEHHQNITDILKRLGEVSINTNCKLLSIGNNSCCFERADGTVFESYCDEVVLAMGMKPNKDFAEQFSRFPGYRVLGTNVEYSNIAGAIESGFMAAYEC